MEGGVHNARSSLFLLAVSPLLAYVNQSEARASSKDRRITVNKNG